MCVCCVEYFIVDFYVHVFVRVCVILMDCALYKLSHMYLCMLECMYVCVCVCVCFVCDCVCDYVIVCFVCDYVIVCDCF
jgi:hypothetical protein